MGAAHTVMLYVILNTQQRNFELRVEHTRMHIPHRSAHSPEGGSHATWNYPQQERQAHLLVENYLLTNGGSTHQVTLHTKCHCTYKPFGNNYGICLALNTTNRSGYDSILLRTITTDFLHTFRGTSTSSRGTSSSTSVCCFTSSIICCYKGTSHITWSCRDAHSIILACRDINSIVLCLGEITQVVRQCRREKQNLTAHVHVREHTCNPHHYASSYLSTKYVVTTIVQTKDPCCSMITK